MTHGEIVNWIRSYDQKRKGKVSGSGMGVYVSTYILGFDRGNDMKQEDFDIHVVRIWNWMRNEKRNLRSHGRGMLDQLIWVLIDNLESDLLDQCHTLTLLDGFLDSLEIDYQLRAVA